MNRISLTRHLLETHRRKALVPPSLRQLLETVAQTCIQISQSVGRGALA
ncbi:MAG: fructose-bisphosphatase class I, partial [Betaproteobacteria bacterium]|nr:fructose-bisphosphatase class I [Betaproteobacteria bacterium]